MRITTWNTRQNTELRVPRAFQVLQPHLLIAPETSSRPPMVHFDVDGSHVWEEAKSGHRQKGLGVYTSSGFELDRVAAAKFAKTAVATRVQGSEKSFHLLAIWTQRNERNGTYSGALDDIVGEFSHLLAQGDCVVAGDFNVSQTLSPRTFPSLVRRLRDDFGLTSAFHSFHGVAFGDEAGEQFTYWRRSRGEVTGYHIDYIFVPEDWKIVNVQIGAKEEWAADSGVLMSDHVPVTVDIDF